MILKPFGAQDKIAHKGLFIVAVPLVIGTAFLLLLYVMLAQSEGEVLVEEHSREVMTCVFTVGKELLKTINAVAAYTFMPSESVGQRYMDSRKSITDQYGTLKKLVRNNPSQLTRAIQAEKLELRALKICDGLKESVDEGENVAHFIKVKELRNQLEATIETSFDMLLELINSAETEGSQRSQATVQMRHYMKVLILLGVVANFVVSTSLVLLFSREITKRVKILTDNASRLASGKPLLPEIGGTDEVAQLDHVFHTMAVSIEEAEKKQRALVDNAVDVICSIDKNNRFVAVSPACEKVWGFQPAELIGRRFVDLIDPNDLNETLNAISSIKKVETTVQVENRIKAKDGRKMHVLWSAYWSEKEELLYCVAHDITARKLVEKLIKESEERTRSIMEGLPVGLVVINDIGVIELSNPKAIALFGGTEREFLGRKLASLFVTDEEMESTEWLNELVSSTSNHVVELTAVREDGTLFPVEISCNGIQFKGGVLHLVAMLDVTERHEIERMKREFVAMVSHDLRTPLSSVQGMLALLSAGAAGNLPARAGSIVETAEGQLERLISLINDLLDIQKMESGRFQIERDEVLVKDLLDQSLEAVEQVAKAAKVEFSLPETNARMIADGARIIQVLVNLFSNAIKFSPADGSVEVTVIESPTEVEFRVEDHGRGIPPEHIDAVFERFRQVEPGDAKEKKGTGLGLAICKMIVEGHGGTIGVRSEPGKGSTFWFKIPVH